MLRLVIPAMEYYDDEKAIFVNTKEQALSLEHSLVSMSKWEARWNKPFLSKENKTFDETLDYIQCMTITQNVDPLVYLGLSEEQIVQVTNYIDAPMTATVFMEDKTKSTNREIITSEVLYYYFTVLNIPFECQKWHLNRLLTLIRVCSIKNAPPEKMSRKELLARNRDLNSSRKAELNTKG